MGEENELVNVAIYVDYENLYKRLKDYELHPVRNLNFFKVVSDKFKESGHNVVKFISFANFEDSDFEAIDQTKIHNFGVDVRHCSLDGKSSTDSEMTVEILRDLYKDEKIEVFVIISNDRDYIPVVKAIKSEGKTTYTLTTKKGTNPIVNVFSDYHQYIEDLFQIQQPIEQIKQTVTELMLQKAKDVSSFLYNSNIYKSSIKKGELISLKGYSSQLKKLWKESQTDIENYFNHAHDLGYIEIYEKDKTKYLKEGKLYLELQIVKEDIAI